MPNGADERQAMLHRPARRLTVECRGPSERGLRELRPRRLNYAKLVATLLRQLLDKHPARPVAAATVLMPLISGDAEAVLDLLPDVPRLTLVAPLFQGALDQLAGLTGRTALAVVGDAEPPTTDAHQALARALVTHDRGREQRLAERLLRSVTDGEVKREFLVVEERPGKAQPLDLGRATVKQAARRFEAARDAGLGRPPLSAPPGFGAAGLVVGSDDSGHGRRLNVASLDWRPPGGVLSLDTMKVLKEAQAAWLAGLGLDPGALQRLVVSTPWMAVSGFIGAALTGRDIVDHPDQLYGWQPLMTLLDFLATAELPALLVYGGRHPTVHLVAIWT